MKEKWFVGIVVWRYFAVEENMTVTDTELSLCKWGDTLILRFFQVFPLSVVWNSST